MVKVWQKITAKVCYKSLPKNRGKRLLKHCSKSFPKHSGKSLWKLQGKSSLSLGRSTLCRRKWILLREIKVCQGLSFAKLEVTSSWVRIKLSWQQDTGEWIASQWRVEGNSTYIMSVQYSGGGLYKTFVPMKWSRGTCHDWKCTTMAYFDCNLLGGWRLLGGSLGDQWTLKLWMVLWWLGGGGGGSGAGVLREPMDSNRSFPVMLTLSIDFAAFEIFRHMLDFKSSMSCLGSG